MEQHNDESECEQQEDEPPEPPFKQEPLYERFHWMRQIEVKGSFDNLGMNALHPNHSRFQKHELP